MTLTRNPSTHDYLLDFDEDEALLAIVSVCAFAIVLIDQMAEKLSFDAGRSVAENTTELRAVGPLLPLTIRFLQQFATKWVDTSGALVQHREAELIGAIAGFLTATMRDVSIRHEALLSPEMHMRPDLIVATPDETVLIEVKTVPATESNLDRAIQQVIRYLDDAGVNEAVVYFHPTSGVSDTTIDERLLTTGGRRVRRVVIVHPRLQ